MVTPRRSVKKVRWIRGFIVAFLAFTAAILLTAKPVIASDMVTAKPGMANAWGLIIDVKEDGGKVKIMTIRVNETTDKVSATMEGKELKVSDKVPFPIVLGKHTGKIAAIYPGPTIVFEGSTCVLIRNRWISYPPGTVCP
jgi:hypothetical protein